MSRRSEHQLFSGKEAQRSAEARKPPIRALKTLRVHVECFENAIAFAPGRRPYAPLRRIEAGLQIDVARGDAASPLSMIAEHKTVAVNGLNATDETTPTEGLARHRKILDDVETANIDAKPKKLGDVFVDVVANMGVDNQDNIRALLPAIADTDVKPICQANLQPLGQLHPRGRDNVVLRVLRKEVDRPHVQDRSAKTGELRDDRALDEEGRELWGIRERTLLLFFSYFGRRRRHDGSLDRIAASHEEQRFGILSPKVSQLVA
jgi:hypothetical protein